jgi:8-oxo-dGTP pyrophosphatase MutT (NUDIX family)
MLDDPDRGGLLVGEDDRVLLVRKRATKAFMQPGGKIEPCEAPIAALLRELREELGLVIPSHAAIHLGRFTAPGRPPQGNQYSAGIDRLERQFFRSGLEQWLVNSERVETSGLSHSFCSLPFEQALPSLALSGC